MTTKANGRKRRMDVWAAALLLGAVCLVALYDLFVPSLWPGSDTVSAALWLWSTNYPMLPFAVGVVIGHLFWHR